MPLPRPLSIRASLLKWSACFAAFWVSSSALADNASEALRIISLAANHASQGRSILIRNTILMQAAQAKAEDILARNYFNHTDPSGIGPNRLAESYGYQLPSFYSQSQSANNIESLYAESGYGPSNADRAFESWLESTGHRSHLLAENSFYADQTHVGVGVASGGGENVFVFLSAPPFNGGQGAFIAVDTWSASYADANLYYSIYSALGDTNTAAGLYFFFRGLGDYSYSMAYGNEAAAAYSYYNAISLYYYYISISRGDLRAASYYFNFYLGIALYYYHIGNGDSNTASQLYNHYINLAYSAYR
jgi:hypothetical protein